MKSIIEELYHGRINPYDKVLDTIPDYNKFLEIFIKNEEQLLKLLDNNILSEYSSVFKNYSDAFEEMLHISETERFIDGFKLGARFALEMFALFENN